jgi:hypothetical protein
MMIANKLLKSENKLEMCLEQNNFFCFVGLQRALTYSSNF